MTAPERAYSLFQQPWWLDAVAPGAWSEVTVTRQDRVVARLPYVRKTRWGLSMLAQPPLTPTLGPWIEPSPAKQASALAHEMDLLIELVERLPPADRFAQAFDPQLLNALPFYWAGYEIGVRYTYRLEDLTSIERLWDGLDSSARGTIRKAQRHVEIRTDLGLGVAYDLVRKTFARQGLPVPYPRSLLERIDAACAPRGARELLFAADANGRVHAANYVVFDGATAYGLVSGADPALRSSGAGVLLIWEAVRRVASSTAVFDFEGSMLRPVAHLFRTFGTRQTPYLVVSRHSRRLRTLLALKELGDVAASLRPRRAAADPPR